MKMYAVTHDDPNGRLKEYVPSLPPSEDSWRKFWAVLVDLVLISLIAPSVSYSEVG